MGDKKDLLLRNFSLYQTYFKAKFVESESTDLPFDHISHTYERIFNDKQYYM